MAKRPLTFGIRYGAKGRTVPVRADLRDPSRYVLEVRGGGKRVVRREHGSLGSALKDFASAWRQRLH